MNEQPLQNLLLRLWHHISHRRRVQFCFLFILMILASFAEILSIGAVLPFLSVLTSPEEVFSSEYIQPLIRLFNLTQPDQLLLPLTVLFGIAALVSGGLRLLLLWAQTRLSHAIGADFSISIYHRTLFQPYAVHVSRNSSEIISAISNKANSVVSVIVMPILVILSSVLMLLTILIAMLAIEPVIALSAFIGFGCIYGLVVFFNKTHLANASRIISFESNQVIKALQEGLGGIRDVIIDGTQSVYCNIYRKADLPLRRAKANIQIIGNSPRYGIEALGMILIAGLAFSLVKRSGEFSTVVPVLGALALGAQRLLPVLQQGYVSWTSIKGGQNSLQDTLDLLEQELPAHADQQKVNPIQFKQDISLTNLSYRYGETYPWIIKDLNLSIPKGSCTGIIGTTGSGKSTLLDIIMGLLSPTQGGLAIDGVAVTVQNHRSWQLHIAHVPQVIFLADSSIAENIAFGVPSDKIKLNLVKEAAKKAQIAENIESWDEKYMTVVGERGIRLSGGQRQRIGIARAIYKKADVIVFDEATSSLDNETEQAVMDAIENLGTELTILIVAHRLSTLKKCSQIIELKNGYISRKGSFQEIVSPDL